ncbi:hypothetical protein HDU97_008210 [Phlyctochytrium planicorne]|nr:hypothetical protein HDU97_008210 [Phlyctochytrium planicorne]
MSRTPTLKLKVSAPKAKIVLKSGKQEPSSSRKRKADDTEDEEDYEDDEDELPVPKAKKSRGADKPAASGSTVSKEDVSVPAKDLKEVLNRLTNVIRQAADKKGRILCTLFKTLPSRAQYPDYYEIITNPIALNQIQTKAQSGKYSTVRDLREDVALMFNNAKQYNVAGSQIFSDAEHMMSLFDAEYDKIASEFATKAPAERTPILKILPPKKKDTPKKPAQEDVEMEEAEAPPSSKKKGAKSAPEQKQAVSSKELEDDIKAIFTAIAENNVKNVEMALKKGVDPNTLFSVTLDKVDFSWAALHAASYNGRTRIMDVLVSHGANVELGDSHYDNKPLHWAVKGLKDGVAKRLVKTHHADKAPKNKKGQTPLDLAPKDNLDFWKETILSSPGSKKEVEEDEHVKVDPREKRAAREKQSRDEEIPKAESHHKKPPHTPGGQRNRDLEGGAAESRSTPKSKSELKGSEVTARSLFHLGPSRAVSPPPDPRGPHQLLVLAPKLGYIREAVLQIPELNIFINLGTSGKARTLAVPHEASKAFISIQLAPGTKGTTYSVYARQNRIPLQLRPSDDGYVEAIVDLIDGINALEYCAVAYKGDGGDDLTLLTKEEPQKFHCFVSRWEK